MNKGSNRDAAKKAGLSVRYCFDVEQIDSKPSSEEPQNDENTPQVVNEELPVEIDATTLAANSNSTRKPQHHPSRQNYWFLRGFGASDKQQSLLDLAYLRRRQAYPAGVRSCMVGGGQWRGDVEEDPGFFVTDKVQQPPKEDTLSWDSSCSESSSDVDIRDNFGQHNRSGSRAGLRTCPWGSAKSPVPPSARDMSANKLDDPRISTMVASAGTQGGNKKVENTYRLEPKAGQTFVWYKAKRPMVNIVDHLLSEVTYNAKSGPAVSRKLCEVIMKMIKKNFDWPRYRFVCHVVLAQLQRQGIMIADRALWNTSVDNVASYVYTSRSLVCVVTLHALYCE